jgi:hypothetical protein
MTRRTRPVRRLAAIAAPLMLAGALAGLAPAAASTGTCHNMPGPAPVSPGATFTQLAAVTALSACDVWAVGDASGRALILHFDGTRWTRSVSPSAGPGSALFGVAATSHDDAWAVGEVARPAPGGVSTLILHWNGAAWSTVHSPTPNGFAQLNGVAATAAGNAWAVGRTDALSTGHILTDRTLALHWDGHAWARVSTPNPAGNSTLNAVTLPSAGGAWAVGATAPAGSPAEALAQQCC